MEVIGTARFFDVNDPSSVSQVRRAVLGGATDLGLAEKEAGRAGLLATEMCTNLLKHAGGGEFVFAPLPADGPAGIDLLALDRGPGIRDMERCLRDGYSTAGSPGTGLGAIRRQSQAFDVFAQPDGGSVVHARILAETGRTGGADICGFTVPVKGESVSGDCWAVRRRRGGFTLVGADGLGHGANAADASRGACRVLHEDAGHEPVPLMERAHRALAPTRGAAVAIADVDFDAGRIAYAAIGNLAGTLVSGGSTRKMLSHNGIVGHMVRHMRSPDYRFTGESALILHSDGLTTNWQLDRYPGLLQRSSAVIAGVLFRDFRRGRDDALIVVAKWGAR